MFRVAVLVCWTARVALAASLLEQHVDQALRTTTAIDGAAIGIEVIQLATGKLLYARDADKLFTPASNTKLFTTALAFSRLGPDYRIKTRVLQSGRDVVIVGGGDPSMSFNAIPYSNQADLSDPLAGIEIFADGIVAAGIQSIAGDIVGDDTAFRWEPFAPGWGVDDPIWEYGAPVSALCLGSNSVRVGLVPGTQDGDPVTLNITPALEYLTIGNRLHTTTSSDQKLEVRRMAARQVQLIGGVSTKAENPALWLAVDDPALYTATALYDTLTRRGVRISGRPVARHRYEGPLSPPPSGPALAERLSPPLVEMLKVTDKVSQNLWAELMLRQVALVRTGDGSRRAGLNELKMFLAEIGIADTDYVFEDGSGLSRTTLVKPAAVIRLLMFMATSPMRDAWLSLLPVGAQDGSLEKRFHKDPAAKNIQAKTGSLSHVSALSGYADSATYGQLAFSIMVNHAKAPTGEVRDFIDKIGMILLE